MCKWVKISSLESYVEKHDQLFIQSRAENGKIKDQLVCVISDSFWAGEDSCLTEIGKSCKRCIRKVNVLFDKSSLYTQARTKCSTVSNKT